MILNYAALGILLMGLTLVFYGFIYVHDIPYNIAKKRNHPHAESIHVACWLSLFTLHAIWPIVFIWAVSKTGEPLAVRVVDGAGAASDDLLKRIALLEERVRELSAGKPASGGVKHG